MSTTANRGIAAVPAERWFGASLDSTSMTATVDGGCDGRCVAGAVQAGRDPACRARMPIGADTV